VTVKNQDDEGKEEDSWLERFFAGITTEAKEIYEGAKNFAKNTVQLEKGQNKQVDPAIIHQDFDEIYGWSQMYYEVQLFDVDFARLYQIQESQLRLQAKNLRSQEMSRSESDYISKIDDTQTNQD